MKKYISLILALVMLLCMAACGTKTDAPAVAPTAAPETATSEASAVAPTEEPIVLVFADTEVPGMPEYEGNLYFIQLIEERSNGRIKVEYHPNNELGGDKDITAAAIAGTVDICKCAAGNLMDWTDAIAFTDIPGVYKNTAHMRAVWQSDIRDQVSAEIVADTTLTPVMFDCDGGAARALFYNADHEIRTPADCKSLKFRTTGSEIEMGLFSALGIASTPMAFTELYTSLQGGVIDGIYTHPEGTYMNSLCEVTNYCSIINLSYITTFKLMSASAVEKLGGVGSELYNIVIEAGKEAEVHKDELIAAYNVEVEGLMEGINCHVVHLTDEEQEQFYEVARGLWDQYVGDGKMVSQEMFDRIVEIGNDF